MVLSGRVPIAKLWACGRFDRVVDGKVRIVDASWKQPKWRFVELGFVFEAIKRHDNENSGGVWHFEKQG